MAVRPKMFAVYQKQYNDWVRVTEPTTHCRVVSKWGQFVDKCNARGHKLRIKRSSEKDIVGDLK